MRILRAHQHRSMPWKNGGGETLEIAISPRGAAVDAFDWRLSMAKVLASGPFSAFKNTDRVLAVLDGALMLAVAGRPTVRLDTDSAAYLFAGDAAAEAEVLSTVTDLNVMVRRGAFSAEVRRLDHARVEACDGETFVLVRANARLATGEMLECNDVLHLTPSATVVFDAVPPDAWLIAIRGATPASLYPY